MPSSTRSAYQLLHDGSLVLAQIEKNGIRIDTDYLTEQILYVKKRVEELESELYEMKEWKVWSKRYRATANLDSKTQLSDVIFHQLEHKSKGGKTEKGRDKSDESAYAHLDLPFLKKYFEAAKLKKAGQTYLKNIQEECVDGFLHPFYNLHTTVSFRGSSNMPNFQNMPVRSPMIAKIIRECFIPRGKKHHLVELDFSGIEVKIAACYHNDPTMLTYINDPTTDMHRDMAMQCYLLDIKQISKQARYCAKNQFVFPQFYGSFYSECAKALWESIDRMDLKVEGTDKSLKDHLAEKGIKKLGSCTAGQQAKPGTFEHHIKNVEKDFWGRRFPVYDQWKKDWWNAYQRKGGFRTLTGFYIEGVFRRNQVINLPVQGCAFHCLLWVLIQLEKWLRKHKMRTLIVGQIHDSILLDAPEDELQDVLNYTRQLMTKDLPAAWKWIDVPIAIESEVCELGKSWYTKKEWTKRGKIWEPK